jgi:hypothetical protein
MGERSLLERFWSLLGHAERAPPPPHPELPGQLTYVGPVAVMHQTSDD